MSNRGMAHIPGTAAASDGFNRRLAASVLLINLLVILVAGFSLYKSFGNYQERAEITTRNLATVLAQNIESTIDKVDLGLQAAADEIERQIAKGKADAGALSAYMTQLQGRLPWVIGLRATDERGMVKYGVDVPKDTKIDLADRAYFIGLRDDPHFGLFINKPVMSRINKVWVVNFARRLNHPDGTFAGVVFANIPLENLGKNFPGINVGSHGFINLRDSEMGLVVRYPGPQDPGSVSGKNDASPQYAQAVRANPSSGTFYSPVGFDDVARMVSYQKIGHYPLYVSAGLARQDYLAAWQREVLQISGLAILFILVSSISSWMVGRSWRQQLAATHKLAQEEEKFHTVADYTYDWEYWEGVNRELIYISPSCERITGYSPAEFQADPTLLDRVLHPDDRHLMLAHVHDDARAKDAALDFRIVRRDGGVRWIAHACQAVFGRDGQYLGRRASNRDITERHQAEEKVYQLNEELELRVAQRTALLESANKEIEDFSYSISHDMLIPLRAIDGFSQILLDEQSARLDDEGKRMLGMVRHNAARMAGQIEGILSFLRMGKRELICSRIDMARLASEVLAELQAASPERKMRVEIGELPEGWGDREMMRQVMMHLLSNALKFSRTDSDAVIELSGTAEGLENIYRVRDYGIGFDMRYVGKLFKVFERVHPTGQYEGSGVGLAIVKRIITRHGGRVWAEGKVNEGTTIYFALPANERRKADRIE